jgi:hypothetical protein
LIIGAECPAQEAPGEEYAKMITDGAAREAIGLALAKIGTVNCEANQYCTPATAEELQQPPITLQDARASMVFAIRSALAAWCGLDWRRSFQPMIILAAERRNMNKRQLVLLSLVHGDFQTRQLAFYKNSGKCPISFKEKLDRELPTLMP